MTLSERNIILFSGASVFYNAYFGQGFGPIFLDDLLCTGREANVIDCPRSSSTGVGDVDFCRGHLDDAGLRCVEGRYECSYVSLLGSEPPINLIKHSRAQGNQHLQLE